MDTRNQAHKKAGSIRGLLLVSLSRFYADDNNMRAVLPYINGESPVSLRLIDWFVTNYAKHHDVYLTRQEASGETRVINVYHNYRSQLKAYSKQQFDPFRRRDRIELWYPIEATRDRPGGPEHAKITTTVGQLNFFRWMLMNGVLEHVSLNAVAIEADMVASQHANASCQEDPDDDDSIISIDEDPEGLAKQGDPLFLGAKLSEAKGRSDTTMTRLGTRTLAFD